MGYNCLTSNQVDSNHKLFGKNSIVMKTNKLKQFFIYKGNLILLIILLISLFDIKLDTIIFIFICIAKFVLDIITIKKTDKILKHIKEISNTKCTVIRDNKNIKINANDITINDVIYLKKGDFVPCDSIILESVDLIVNEEILNIKNRKVHKSTDLIDKNVNLKSNYIYDGSIILEGNCIAKVISIGNNTYKNKLNKIANKSGFKFIMFGELLLYVIIFIIMYVISKELINSIILSFTMLYFLYPSNFFNLIDLLIFTNQKLFDKKIIVKNYNIIKYINCVDKIIFNKDKLLTNGKKIKVLENFVNLDLLNKNIFLSTNIKNNDNYSDYTFIKKINIPKNIKLNANVYKHDNKYYIYVSGDLETIFDICDMNVQDKYNLFNLKNDMEEEGYRVIAIGSSKIDDLNKDILDYNIHFDGLISFYDNIKSDIEECIDYCNFLNLNAVIISNDKDVSLNKTIKNLKIYENIYKNENRTLIIDPNISVKKILSDKNINIETSVKEYDFYKNSIVKISIESSHEAIKQISDVEIANDNLNTIINFIDIYKKIFELLKKGSVIFLVLNILCSTLVLVEFTVNINFFNIIIIICNILVNELLLFYIKKKIYLQLNKI